MRGKNAAINLIFYVVYEILVFALGIIFPRLIIGAYGSEFNGLTSTITRALSLINLVQAGAIGAASYQMFGPVAKNDYDTQSAIIYSSKRFYNRIVLVYLFIAIGIGIFYSFRLESDNLSFFTIFLSFFILTINGALALRLNSICDIYITSHQKKYLLIISMIANLFVYYGLLSIILILRLNFLTIYFAYLFGGLANVALNLFFYKRMTKGKIANQPSNKNFVIPDRKTLMLTSIGSEIVTLSPTIIISTFLGLTLTSVFSIYAVIFTSMKTVINSIQLSIAPIFGNVTKTSDEKKIYQVYDLIELITISIGSILAACVGFLIIPFVTLYTKNITDANYVYPVLGVFISVYVLLFTFRSSFSYVPNVYGLFKKLCIITLSSGGVGVIISVLCSLLWGMPYVMIGLLFNQLACSVATLIISKKDIAWFSIKKLIIRSSFMCVITFVGNTLSFTFLTFISDWMTWLLFAALAFAICALLVLLYCVLFERQQLKSLIPYVKSFVKHK